ncbi:MAG: hypothetical protein M1379_14570 [Firmicutes bacterium]|nr:hypothetical protein [Bacillota bacterium]
MTGDELIQGFSSGEIAFLRSRKEDIPLLIERFLAEMGDARRPGPELLSIFLRHGWPGNVRELRNCVEYLCMSSVMRRGWSRIYLVGTGFAYRKHTGGEKHEGYLFRKRGLFAWPHEPPGGAC